MKKVVATVLALGMTTLLFAACDKPSDETTTGGPVGNLSTTTNSTTTATTTAPVETTTVKAPLVFSDDDMVDSTNYGYYCKILRNENKEAYALAVSGWKTEDATADMVIDAEYSFRDSMGVLYTLPIVQVGVGQGVPAINFQSKLESVTIAEGVTKIANKAFPQCTKLKTLNLPEGLTSIGDMAFWNCKSLETLVIPSTVTEIGSYAFSACTSLKSVTLPARFESQVANIFDGCPNVVITYTNE